MEIFKLKIIIVQVIASVLYIGGILIVFGIIPSISDSFLELRKKFGNRTMVSGLIPVFLFWGYLAIIGISIFIFLDFHGLGFLSMAGLLLLGAASDISVKSVRLPHGIGAVTGIVVAFIGLGVYSYLQGYWLVGLVIVPQLLIMLKLYYWRRVENWYVVDYSYGELDYVVEWYPVKNIILWIEISALFWIVVGEIWLYYSL